MMFAGFLRREPVEMVKCETNDLEVPAKAEIVLEGYVASERDAHGRTRSGITPDFIRWKANIRYFTSRASRTGKIRFI